MKLRGFYEKANYRCCTCCFLGGFAGQHFLREQAASIHQGTPDRSGQVRVEKWQANARDSGLQIWHEDRRCEIRTSVAGPPYLPGLSTVDDLRGLPGHAQDCSLLDVFAMHQQQVVNDLNRTIREFINARQCLAFFITPDTP